MITSLERFRPENCNYYGIHRASNPNPLNDDTKTNDNELHQQLCIHSR